MENNGYSITKWHDTKPIYEKLDKLLAQPPRLIKKDKMEAYLQYFNSKCSKSKNMIEEAKKFIPGGVQHNLAFNYPFPIVVEKADGAYMWDIDGNRYIDFLQAGGPTILGSNYTSVQEKVIDVIKQSGPVTGLFHEYELKLAELINRHMPSVEMFRALGSGTESVMAAIRIARLATGKKKVIKVGGAYHGWSDQMVYSLHIPRTGRFEAHGIPRGNSANTQAAMPNDIGKLERMMILNKLRGGTAAVIVEPAGPESGTRPVSYNFNKQVRELCDKYGALLIFDEVVTGFRFGLGGAQGYFGIKPDLTVFGKVIAGGYPSAGGVGGRRDLMEHVAAGIQSGKKRAYVGGTLAANPLSCAAGYYTILEIERTNACYKAGLAGNRLTEGLQFLIDKYKLPYVAYNQGSICHLETTGAMFINLLSMHSMSEINTRKSAMEKMGAAYMAEGIITLAGSRMYTSLADTDDVIDDALNKFESVFKNVEGV